MREAQDVTGGSSPEDAETRKQKLRELKKWLKKKEKEVMNEEQAPPQESPQERLERMAARHYPLDKLEQDHIEMRERRAKVAEQRRRIMEKLMADGKPKNDRVVHRHVHHHIHYHD